MHHGRPPAPTQPELLPSAARTTTARTTQARHPARAPDAPASQPLSSPSPSSMQTDSQELTRPCLVPGKVPAGHLAAVRRLPNSRRTPRRLSRFSRHNSPARKPRWSHVLPHSTCPMPSLNSSPCASSATSPYAASAWPPVRCRVGDAAAHACGDAWSACRTRSRSARPPTSAGTAAGVHRLEREADERVLRLDARLGGTRRGRLRGRSRTPPGGVRSHPGDRQRRGERAQHDGLGQLSFGGEGPLVGDLRSVAALAVVRLGLGQIQLAVHQGASAGGGVGGEDACRVSLLWKRRPGTSTGSIGCIDIDALRIRQRRSPRPQPGLGDRRHARPSMGQQHPAQSAARRRSRGLRAGAAYPASVTWRRSGRAAVP